jgi:hypothetical protein
MRLSVRQLVADDEDLEPVGDAQAGKQHLRVQARCVGDGYHRNICAIRQRKQGHQARQRLKTRAKTMPGTKAMEQRPTAFWQAVLGAANATGHHSDDLFFTASCR